MNDMIKHYDLLIDENNDPVHDPEPLRAYMDLWDGQRFLEDMLLTADRSVLEIGVGTGRLAVRVAPLCREFVGIDISPKTAARARENLKAFSNVKIICHDFMDYRTDKRFDVIYTSLTFMHICDKKKAIEKIHSMLHVGGRLVLSIDKNQADTIDCGTRKISVFPDRPDRILQHLKDTGMHIRKQYETEHAHIFVACHSES